MASRLVTTIALFTIITASGRAPAAPDPAVEEPAASAATRSAIATGLAVEATLQSASLSSDLLEVVAQVIVDRATTAGWGILRDKITSSLDCDHSTSEYRQTCKLLATSRLQDLVAAPQLLLDAAVDDFTAIWRPKLATVLAQHPGAATVLGGLVLGAGGFLAAWTKHGDRRTAFAVVASWATERLAKGATACPTDEATLPIDLTSAKATRGIALCLLDSATSKTKKLAACDLAAKLDGCGGDDPAVLAAAEDLRQTLLAPHGEDVAEGVLGFYVHGAAQRLRDLPSDDCFAKDDTKKAANLCAAMVDDVGSVAVGLARQDWNKVTSGALDLITDYGKLNQQVAGSRYFQLLAAIGQYALTYQSPTGAGSPTDRAASRKQIIETLLKETTDRSERHGWVVSLGGSLGVGGLYRHAIGDSTRGWSGPFILPIGLGLQWYPHDSNVGFHAQLGLFDVGHYVTYEDNHDVSVGRPDAKAAVAPSIALGVWFGSRATPIFVGPYGGVAPFVLSSGKPEYFIGGMLGAYVPIFDF